MSKIKLKTDLKHRYGKTVNLNGNVYEVSNIGEIEVDMADAKQAVLTQFYQALGEKSVDIEKTDKETDDLAKGEEFIKGAKLEAEKIIADAKLEAEKIIADAKLKAGEIYDNSLEKEKADTREALNKKTVAELKDYIQVNKFPEEEWKGLTLKADLIEYILGKVYA